MSALSLGGSPCALNQTGFCRAADMTDYVEVCASGVWQRMPLGSYICKEGHEELSSTFTELSASTTIYSLVSESADALASVSGAGGSSFAGSAAPEPTGIPAGMANMTGNAWCGKVAPPARDDNYGIASYRPGGKMASMYIAAGGPLRCDLPYPANNFFVAVWTRYNGDVIGSQPQPANCGEFLSLTNPKTGKTTLAPVLDRCASCVGVGRQTSDPTTADLLVNGATVDLSQELFNYLYENAGTGVYDIEYNGTVYGGEPNGDPPDPLSNPDCG